MTLSVGVGATKAPWSGTLRSHVRDHGQGLSVRVIMDRGELERAATGLDVLVIDDVMRTFSICCGWAPGEAPPRPPVAGPLLRSAPPRAGRRDTEASSMPGPR